MKLHLSRLKSEMSHVKLHLSHMKSEMSQMKLHLSYMKSETARMKSDMSQMKLHLSYMKRDMGRLKRLLRRTTLDESRLSATKPRSYEHLRVSRPLRLPTHANSHHETAASTPPGQSNEKGVKQYNALGGVYSQTG
jgi:chromosome segregation ATPase